MFKVALCIYKVFNGGTSFVFGYSFFSGKSSSRRISKIDFQNCAHVARVLFRRRMFCRSEFEVEFSSGWAERAGFFLLVCGMLM